MAEGLSIHVRDGAGIATIMARRGAARDGIAAALGLRELPGGPCLVQSGGLQLVGTGPGVWLAVQEGAAPGWAEGLAEAVRPLASVSDQSGGYVLFRLQGPDARRLLQRGVAIDLHPDAFPPGSAATSVAAHIGVTFWCVDVLPTYDVAIFRSYRRSFQHWLDATMAAL